MSFLPSQAIPGLLSARPRIGFRPRTERRADKDGKEGGPGRITAEEQASGKALTVSG